jgi:hypothetical protein
MDGQMTREEAKRVVNEAADLVIEEMGWGDDATREEDAVNLLVNVFGAMLDNPDTTVDEVMNANYESGAEMVRSWSGWGCLQVALQSLVIGSLIVQIGFVACPNGHGE